MSITFKEGIQIDAIETTYQRFDKDDKPIDIFAYTRHIEIRTQFELGEFAVFEIDSRDECQRLINILNDLSNKCFGG